MASARITKRVVEENTMAILDSSGVRDARDILDDKLCFLEAVRAACLLSDSSTVPTWKMCNAVFQIFWDKEASLELVVASHQLLIELDQRYPRVYVVNAGEMLASGKRCCEVVVLKEAWSPFSLCSNNGQREGEGSCSRRGRFLVDSADLFVLVQEVAEAVNDIGCLSSMKLVRKMLLVQYLYSVLEGDFLARQTAYKETMNWVLVRESLLNMLLGSRRLNFKSFVKDCISIINKRCQTYKGSRSVEHQSAERTCTNGTVDYDVALVFALSELEKKTCVAVQKLLVLSMELDAIKKEADTLRLTSRADAARTPALELLVDELTYHKDDTSMFLLVFSECKWKLEIALQYVWKYCSKPAVHTRKTSRSEDDTTLDSLFAYLLNATNMKNVARKIGVEEVQLLLSHAFEHDQVMVNPWCLPDSKQVLFFHYLARNVGSIDGRLVSSSLLKICSDFISVFQNLRQPGKMFDVQYDYTPLPTIIFVRENKRDGSFIDWERSTFYGYGNGLASVIYALVVYVVEVHSRFCYKGVY